MSGKQLKSLLSSLNRELTSGDKILICVILLFGFFSLYAVNYFKNPGNTLQIEVSGQVKHILKLDNNQSINVTGEIGKTSVKIEDGKVWIDYSDCPEKICVKTGKIHRAGDIIVCVPNKVVVAIHGKKKSNFDVITQ